VDVNGKWQVVSSKWEYSGRVAPLLQEPPTWGKCWGGSSSPLATRYLPLTRNRQVLSCGLSVWGRNRDGACARAW